MDPGREIRVARTARAEVGWKFLCRTYYFIIFIECTARDTLFHLSYSTHKSPDRANLSSWYLLTHRRFPNNNNKLLGTRDCF